MITQRSLLIDKGYIPLDIPWTINIGILELINDRDYILDVLKKQKELPTELRKFYELVKKWKIPSDKRVVETDSELIYKSLTIANLRGKIQKNIIKKGILSDKYFNEPQIEKIIRNENNRFKSLDAKLKTERSDFAKHKKPKSTNKGLEDIKIKREGLEKMLSFDQERNGWAVAYILANEIKTNSVEYPLLEPSFRAVRHLQERKDLGVRSWRIRYDDSVLRQAENFVSLTDSGKINFHVKSSNDYPFARVFDIGNPADLRKKYTIYQEETDKAMAEYEGNVPVTSTNERVVQAIAMGASFFGRKVEFKHPDCAGESWPQFWRFLEDYKY